MTIDPMLYKKISGRSGDVTDMYGKALADQSTRKTELGDASLYMATERRTNKNLMKIIIPVIVILVIGSALFFR